MQTDLALNCSNDAFDGELTTIPNDALKELSPVDPTRSNPNPNCGERALLRAVLQDAILCLTGQGVEKHERATVAAEARRWMLSRSRRWLFAFESICDILDINPDYLRDKLLRAGNEGPRRTKKRGLQAAPARDVARAFRSCRLRGNQTTRVLR